MAVYILYLPYVLKTYFFFLIPIEIIFIFPATKLF